MENRQNCREERREAERLRAMANRQNCSQERREAERVRNRLYRQTRSNERGEREVQRRRQRRQNNRTVLAEGEYKDVVVVVLVVVSIGLFKLLTAEKLKGDYETRYLKCLLLKKHTL